MFQTLTYSTFLLPFYIRLFVGSPHGQIIVLAPSATPNATRYAFDTEILPRFSHGVKSVDVDFPSDPFVFLKAATQMKRLDRIQSAVVASYQSGSNAPSEIRYSFPRDAATLNDFRAWYENRKKEDDRTRLISVRFSATLEDVEGKTFDIQLHPESKSQIIVSVSQKSENVSDAYCFVTDVLHKIIDKKGKSQKS